MRLVKCVNCDKEWERNQPKGADKYTICIRCRFSRATSILKGLGVSINWPKPQEGEVTEKQVEQVEKMVEAANIFWHIEEMK